MLDTRRWLGLLVVALVACSSRESRAARADSSRVTRSPESARASAPASEPGGVILFVGTSLTAGYGLDDPDQAYPGRIAAKIDSLRLPYRVVNAGVSGETSADALHRMDWLLQQPVDVVVLETGANDGLRGLSPDSLRANLRAILDKVRRERPGARVLLVGMEAPPNMGPHYTAAFRQLYPQVARQYHVTLMPFLLSGVAGVDSLNQPDGIHPNARGARIVADHLWPYLQALLQKRPNA